MCGIAAIFSTDNHRKDSFIAAAHLLQKHRGPDSFGQWKDENIGLAHQRLSIQDLTEAGNQPMLSESGRYVMIFNGEIYNHLKLRNRFFPQKKWKGHSDTETLIALFEKEQLNMFQYLIGMWAIAIWDKYEKRLLVSRDRYGQKPLYYRFFPNSEIAIASEIKPLLILGEKNKGNPLMIAEYLALGNYGHLEEQTFFAEVNQLLPGSYAWVYPEQGNLKAIKYWEIPHVPAKEKIDVGKEDFEELKDLLVEAVSSQTISDVPVGASLSGGLDSSLIVGILASQTVETNPISVFTAQTPGSRWDESPFVRSVCEKYGKNINLYTKDLNEIVLTEILEKTILIQEEPFGDPSIIAHGYLMDMAKDVGIKVVLGGQGADEIFRGYHHNIKQLFSHELRRLNFSYVLPEMLKSNYGLQETARIFFGAYYPKLERNMRINSRKQRKSFLSPKLQEATQDLEMNNMLAYANNLEEGLRESILGVHLPHLVHYDDRNGMARSLEGRMPFLDHRLLELVARFKPENYFKNGYSKDLIRKAGKEFLPEKVFIRGDKLGFFTPQNEMLSKNIQWVEEMIGNVDWVNYQSIRNDIDSFKGPNKGVDTSERLWRILSLACWAKLFNVSI